MSVKSLNPKSLYWTEFFDVRSHKANVAVIVPVKNDAQLPTETL